MLLKLADVRKNYGFNQTTFYQWLRDNGMIERANSGYVLGPDAIEGMVVQESTYVKPTGERATIVCVKDDQVKQLVMQYETAELNNKYSISALRNNTVLQSETMRTELGEIRHRVEIVEGQLLLLTKQVELFMK